MPPSKFTAFLDANVLYGARLRSLLISLAHEKLFRVRWSAMVHAEWMRSLASNRPDLDPAQIDHIRAQMDAAVPDCLVIGFEGLIPRLDLPDPNDRHVLAAAIRCRADCIVTFNLRDFPTAVTAAYEIDVVHPDQFLLDVYDLGEAAFIRALREDIGHYRHPPLSVGEYAGSLSRAGLPCTAKRINALAPHLG